MGQAEGHVAEASRQACVAWVHSMDAASVWPSCSSATAAASGALRPRARRPFRAPRPRTTRRGPALPGSSSRPRAGSTFPAGSTSPLSRRGGHGRRGPWGARATPTVSPRRGPGQVRVSAARNGRGDGSHSAKDPGRACPSARPGRVTATAAASRPPRGAMTIACRASPGRGPPVEKTRPGSQTGGRGRRGPHLEAAPPVNACGRARTRSSARRPPPRPPSPGPPGARRVVESQQLRARRAAHSDKAADATSRLRGPSGPRSGEVLFVPVLVRTDRRRGATGCRSRRSQYVALQRFASTSTLLEIDARSRDRCHRARPGRRERLVQLLITGELK
jgi:hypothetical protein